MNILRLSIPSASVKCGRSMLRFDHWLIPRFRKSRYSPQLFPLGSHNFFSHVERSRLSMSHALAPVVMEIVVHSSSELCEYEGNRWRQCSCNVVPLQCPQSHRIIKMTVAVENGWGISSSLWPVSLLFICYPSDFLARIRIQLLDIDSRVSVPEAASFGLSFISCISNMHLLF